MTLFALIHIITSVRLDIFPALISFFIPPRNLQPFILGFSLHVNGETKKKVQQSRFKEGNLLRATKSLYIFLFTTIFLRRCDLAKNGIKFLKYHAM